MALAPQEVFKTLVLYIGCIQKHPIDGLHRSSDGLQPTSNGLQPNRDGLHCSRDGLQPRNLGFMLQVLVFFHLEDVRSVSPRLPLLHRRTRLARHARLDTV